MACAMFSELFRTLLVGLWILLISSSEGSHGVFLTVNERAWSTPDYTELRKQQQPYFQQIGEKVVQVQMGGTAFLKCHIHNLGERALSWVRKRDFHILTMGHDLYTNDMRFQVLHKEGSNEWILQIKFVQDRDKGVYECQVATNRGILGYAVTLDVVIPEAFILGNSDFHVKVGSKISLVCIIDKSPTPPEYVFWYHNNVMVNYDTERGGISVTTETGVKTNSRLVIGDARASDSGNYTCTASNTKSASVLVFVSQAGLAISEDKTAAIQRKVSSGVHNLPNFELLQLGVLLMYSLGG